jgi:hypothetical protein
MDKVSTEQFVCALTQIRRPADSIMKFLGVHYESPGRAMTATGLAQAAAYESYHGVNLHYGILARNIGEALSMSEASLSLLTEFVKPNTVTNDEWILVMRPEFAEALKVVCWV